MSAGGIGNSDAPCPLLQNPAPLLPPHLRIIHMNKKEKPHEFEQQYREGLIDLYFGDGSFTQGSMDTACGLRLD